jgi:hypothetical protein
VSEHWREAEEQCQREGKKKRNDEDEQGKDGDDDHDDHDDYDHTTTTSTETRRSDRAQDQAYGTATTSALADVCITSRETS